MRAVLDPNVIISAMLSSSGAPARLMVEWRQGGFELIVSPLLIGELERALAYPKLRKRIDTNDAAEFLRRLGDAATLTDDPSAPPAVRSADRGDDYLIALAQITSSALVSGDKHLLELVPEGLPIYAAADFLKMIQGGDAPSD